MQRQKAEKTKPFRFFTDRLTAMILLQTAVPNRKKGLWTCKSCGSWLRALDLEGGLVAMGHFGEDIEYLDDPYFGRVPWTIGVTLKRKEITDRYAVKCESCDVVNRRHRRN
jgi:hypothetical protein